MEDLFSNQMFVKSKYVDLDYRLSLSQRSSSEEKGIQIRVFLAGEGFLINLLFYLY